MSASPPQRHTRKIRRELDRVELRERAEALGLLMRERRDLEAERRDVNKDYRARIDKLSEAIEQGGDVQRTGATWDDVECETRTEDGRVRVYRLDTGECVSDVPADRQATLPGVA